MLHCEEFSVADLQNTIQHCSLLSGMSTSRKGFYTPRAGEEDEEFYRTCWGEISCNKDRTLKFLNDHDDMLLRLPLLEDNVEILTESAQSVSSPKVSSVKLLLDIMHIRKDLAPPQAAPHTTASELLRRQLPSTAILISDLRKDGTEHIADELPSVDTVEHWLLLLEEAQSAYESSVTVASAALGGHLLHLEDNLSHETEEQRAKMISSAMKRFATAGDFVRLTNRRDSARAHWHERMEAYLQVLPADHLDAVRTSIDVYAARTQACIMELSLISESSLAEETGAAFDYAILELAKILNVSETVTDVMKELCHRVCKMHRNFRGFYATIEECKSRMCCCPLPTRTARKQLCMHCEAILPPPSKPPHEWYVSRWMNVSLQELEVNFQALKKQLRQLEKSLRDKEEELAEFREDNPYVNAAGLKAFERDIQLSVTKDMRENTKMRLVKARSYLATLALGPYAEVPYALPLVGLKNVELPDISARFFIPDRSMDDYEELEQINSSGRHCVYKGTITGRPVVLKQYQLSYGAKSADRSFWREVRLLSKLSSHEAFADITGVFFETKRTGSFAYIELPYYRNGNMREFLRKVNEIGRPYSPMHLLVMLRSILAAIAFLHNEGVLHCDIKQENVLITDGGCPVLADFEIARDANERRTMMTTGSLGGTIVYMAPELLTQPPSACSEKSDMYSFGVLALEVLNIDTAHLSFDTVASRLSILDVKLVTALHSLLSSCVDGNPVVRPSANYALNKFKTLLGDDKSMIEQLQNMEEQLNSLRTSISEKEAEKEAKRQARMRICCVCMDEVDISFGIECCSTEHAAQHDVVAHFHCDVCFCNLVGHEVSRHWLQLRWIEILLLNEEKTKTIRRRVDALANIDIPALREERYAPAFGEMQSNPWYDLSGFNEVFEVVNDMEDELCIPCSHAAPAADRCCCFFDKDEVIRHLDSRTLALYRGALQELRAHRERHRLRIEWEEEKRQLEAASRVERLVREVNENILNSKCPACGQTLGEGEGAFEACAALWCQVADNERNAANGQAAAMGCGAAFCAFCLEPCGRDAHGHVRQCQFNPRPGSFYVPVEVYVAAVRERQIRQLREFLVGVEESVRNQLIDAIHIQLRNLNIAAHEIHV